MSTDTYDITDFPNDLVSEDKLKIEIEASTILKTLLNVEHEVNDDADEVHFTWASALDAGEKTTLDAIVAQHDGVAPPKQARLVHVEEEVEKTGGNYQSRGVTGTDGDVPASVGWHDLVDLSWPHPINLLSAETYIAAANDGDFIEMLGAPDTTVGAITSDVVATDTVINVSDTVLQNIGIGYRVKLFDGTNTDDLGRVLDVDKIAKTITVETAATQGFAAATPTYVQMTKVMAFDIEFTGGQRIVFGESKIGGSYIPANMILRLRYYNKDGAANKRFTPHFEYLY